MHVLYPEEKRKAGKRNEKTGVLLEEMDSFVVLQEKNFRDTHVGGV